MSNETASTGRYGAHPDDWRALVALGLTDDLLPVVSDPNATIAPGSKLSTLGKVPSKYLESGQVIGIPDWTRKRATAEQVENWASVPGYGICVQTRKVRAVDIDIADLESSEAAHNLIRQLGLDLPVRRRADSGKRLLVFRTPDGVQLLKRTLKTATGIIELLGDGQQFVAAGTHPSGARYEWPGGIPTEIPELSLSEVDRLWAMLEVTVGVAPSTTASAPRSQALDTAISTDPIVQHLEAAGLVLARERDGRIHITCPFADEHTSPSSISATTYFPAHTGGYERGHFKCLHAHCQSRSQAAFREALGMRDNETVEFESLLDEVSEDEQPRARFQVQAAGEYINGPEPTWIIDGVLPEGELAVIYGASGSGKSFLALDMLAAISRAEHSPDTKWCGEHKITKPGKCIYIAAEGAKGLRKRIRAYAQHHRIHVQSLGIGVIPDAPDFTSAKDVGLVLDAIRAYDPHPVVILIDTLAAAMLGMNENSGEDVGKFMRGCNALHRATGALVLIVHHSGKDGSKGSRGWSGLRAALECEIAVIRDGADRTVVTGKMRDEDDATPPIRFHLTSVELAVDDDGSAITSCVCVFHTNEEPVPPPEDPDPDELIASELAKDCEIHRLLESTPWEGVHVAELAQRVGAYLGPDGVLKAQRAILAAVKSNRLLQDTQGMILDTS